MSLIRFGDFVADPQTEELRRDGRRIRLPGQSFRVLIALTRKPGELVTRESLQAELWPAQSEVEYEQGLNAAINRLREALGDSAATPKFIETLPRRGYRFIGELHAPVPVPEPVSAPMPTPAAGAAPVHLTTTPPATAQSRGWRYFTGMALLAAVALLTLAALLLGRRAVPEASSPARLQPFTALAGEERAPSFSPDGTRIAFAWNGDPANKGRFDLYVKAMDSEQLLRLTSTPSRWLSAAWSPDGTSIAFTRKTEDGGGVFLVPAMGGAERRLAPAAISTEAFMQLAWSPDSRQIAFATFDASGSHVLRFVNVNTLLVRALPHAPECWNAGLPTFSADGELLAFVCSASVGVYGVYVSDFDARPLRLATVMGEPQGLTWSADQRSLILANDAGDGGALWSLAVDGGALTRLPFGEEGSAPARAGNRIAYVRARQAVDIWRMDLNAADPAASAQRLIYSTRSEMTPQYSPDGSRIVFQSSRSGSPEIWMADAAGNNPLRLTQFNGPLSGAPRWCDDGKRVAFDSRVAGSSAVYVVDVEERQPRSVPAQPHLGLPTWSADCRWIFASDGRSSLFKIAVDGGAAQRFTTQSSYLAQVSGARVIFNVKAAAGVALWSKPVDGGAENALPGMPDLGYGDAWAATNAGVYFTSDAAGATALNYYDFAAARARRVTSIPKPPTPGGGLGLAVSRDGRWLLYTQSGEAQSDIMLMVKK